MSLDLDAFIAAMESFLAEPMAFVVVAILVLLALVLWSDEST